MRTGLVRLSLSAWLTIGACSGGPGPADGGVDMACPSVDLVAVIGLRVRVSNAGTGQEICDATVTAREGAYQETLFSVGSSPCAYYGAIERAGTYRLTATRSGFQDAGKDVTVERGTDCHVIPVEVTLSLQ